MRTPVIPGGFVALFEKWCDRTVDANGRRSYWTLVEKADGRDKVRDSLIETVRSHYDRLEHIAADVERLGYKAAAKILNAELPQGKKWTCNGFVPVTYFTMPPWPRMRAG